LEGKVSGLDQFWLELRLFIGQLGDPFYPRKANALYAEFEEIGMNSKLGYSSPADPIDKHPSFYWIKSHGDIRLTQQIRQGIMTQQGIYRLKESPSFDASGLRTSS
jgi:hypothetical protein